MAYIGESDDVGQRIKNHDLKKDWWTSVVFITTAGTKLNKAHVRYLESRLIGEAKRIGRLPLDNATAPPLPSMSEADIAKMEAFLDNLLTVLPAVRVDMFIERARTVAPAALPVAGPVGTSAATFFAESRKHGLRALAVLQDGEFVVEAGSTARLNWESKAVVAHGYGALHAELKRAGVLQVEGDHCVFTQNYAFQSPSAAAAVVFGRPSNGTLEWHLRSTGETFKDWETRALAVTEETV